MNNEVILEIKGLRKIFKDGLAVPLEVLKGINLTVNKGEFISLMGESGSGKSTLLYQIGFLDSPTEGTVLINGQDVNKLNDKEQSKIRRETIGFVFQFYNLIPNLSVEENILLPIIMSGKNKKDYEQKLEELLKTVGLLDKRKMLPKQLSGGQQQRVAIARAVIMEPDLILADEPTGNLDSISTNEIMRLFKKLNRDRNITIIQVTHSKAVAEFADKIIYLKDGQIVDENEDKKEATTVVETKAEAEETSKKTTEAVKEEFTPTVDEISVVNDKVTPAEEEKPVVIKENIENKAGETVDEEIL